MVLGSEETAAVEQRPPLSNYECLKIFLRSQRTLVNSQIHHVSLERIVPPEYQNRGIYNIDVYHKVRTQELKKIKKDIGTYQIAVGAGIHAYDLEILPMIEGALDSDNKTIVGAKAQLGEALNSVERGRLRKTLEKTERHTQELNQALSWLKPQEAFPLPSKT